MDFLNLFFFFPSLLCTGANARAYQGCSCGSSSCLTKFPVEKQPHCHVQHLGNIITANGIEAVWKPVHVLIIFLIYRDVKWKRQSTRLLFLCYLGSILQPSWAYFHIYIKRILDYIIVYDPANTNVSMILSFIDDKMGVWRRLSVSVDVTHPSPICPPNTHTLVAQLVLKSFLSQVLNTTQCGLFCGQCQPQ